MGIDPKNRDDPKRPDIAAVTFSDCGSRGRGFDPVTHPNLNPAHAGSQGCGDVSGFTDGNSICENSISSATEGQKAGSQASGSYLRPAMQISRGSAFIRNRSSAPLWISPE